MRGWSHGKTEQVPGRASGAGGAAGSGAAAATPSQWATISSIAEKMRCTAETLRKWVRQAERDAGGRRGLTTSELERLKELERENRELNRANETLRKASAAFARAELDRDRGDGGLHRWASGGVRGRANLRRAADRPVDVLRADSPALGSSMSRSSLTSSRGPPSAGASFRLTAERSGHRRAGAGSSRAARERGTRASERSWIAVTVYSLH